MHKPGPMHRMFGLATLLRAVLVLAVFFALGRAAQAEAGPDFRLDFDTGGHRAFIKDLAFTPDGQFVVSASDDKTIRIWDWQSGATLRTLRGHLGDGNDGKVFARRRVARRQDDRRGRLFRRRPRQRPALWRCPAVRLRHGPHQGRAAGQRVPGL